MLVMEDVENSISSVFGRKLAAFRKDKGISQEKLAEYSGISREWISNIETGDAPQLSLDVSYRLAKALGVTLNELLGEKIDMTKLELDEDTAFEMMQKARERKRLQQSA